MWLAPVVPRPSPPRGPGGGRAADARARGDRGGGEPLAGQHHRQQVGALHQRAGRRRRDDGPVVRRNTSQRAELPGAVRRRHIRRDQGHAARSTAAPHPTWLPNCLPPVTHSRGYAEDLPAVGSPVCSAGKYARKHVPWANFTNVPPANSVPFSAFPMGNYASLPTVSFVIPNNDDNMHDGSIAQGDAWLNRQLSGYANWAVANNSLLIVTWDEDDDGSRNQIPTVIYGAHVQPGTYNEQISHYNVLSTLEQMYGLPKTGNAANAPPIATIWGG